MQACAVVAMLRWLLMAFSPPAWAPCLLQLLHGLTFALGYLGCVHFIANWTSEDIAAETRSLFTVLGAHADRVAALAAPPEGLCIWLSLTMMQPKDDAAAA